MRAFKVRPFIVKPFVFDPNAKHVEWFVAAGVVYFLAVVSIVLAAVFSFVDREFSSPTSGPFVVGAMLTFVGHGLRAIGRYIRDTQNRLTEQEDRIRKLEIQVAALTPPSSAP